MHQCPVVVVGGGPVGMGLALQLSKLGVPCLIVNKEPDSGWHPRGNTHNSRTMEHYRRLGLSDGIRALGMPQQHPTDVGYFTTLSGPEIARIPMPSEAEKKKNYGMPRQMIRSSSRSSAAIKCTSNGFFLNRFFQRQASSASSVGNASTGKTRETGCEWGSPKSPRHSGQQ